MVRKTAGSEVTKSSCNTLWSATPCSGSKQMTDLQAHRSARTFRCGTPRPQLLTIHAVSKEARKPRAMPVPRGQKGCREHTAKDSLWSNITVISITYVGFTDKMVIRGLNWAKLNKLALYLHQAISNQSHQQFLAPPLSDDRGILSTVHAGEVKHGYVRLADVVLSELEVGQFSTGGELSSIVGIKMQSLVVHVRRSQQLICIAVVLQIQR